MLDFIYGAYIPDKNGKLKHEAYFDPGGSLAINSKKVARQLNMPLRTFQRRLAKLRAMRLIDCSQMPKQDKRGDYVGSSTWVTARADEYWKLMEGVDRLKSLAKTGGGLGEDSVDNSQPTKVVGGTQTDQDQAVKSTVSGCNGNDNIVICSSVFKETLILVPKAREVVLPAPDDLVSSTENGYYSRAGAPGALPPRNFNSFSERGIYPPPTSQTGSAASATVPLNPATATSNPATINPGIPEVQPQPSAPTSYSDDNQDSPPVAPIDAPASALEVGCPQFRKITQRLVDFFGQDELKLVHCRLVKSWITRSSPLERMTFENLDGVLLDHEGGHKRFHASGHSYRLSLDWLLQTWPQLLQNHMQEQLRFQDADAVGHKLEMMTARAESEFEANVQFELAAIATAVDRDGSDASYEPYFIQPHTRMIYAMIAFHQLGMATRIDEIIQYPRRLKRLQDVLVAKPFIALLARDKYPELFARCGLATWAWESMKQQEKQRYQELLKLKTDAEIWKLEPSHNIVTLS